MEVFLIDEKSGTRINLGDAATTFRGEPVIVRGWEAPRHAASTGRLYVEEADGSLRSYFPSVINAKVVVDKADGIPMRNMRDLDRL